MRRAAFFLGLASLLLAACSQPEFYEMQPSSVTFETKGASRTARAVAKDRRGNEYPTKGPQRWESSNEQVATVDAEGKITAVGSGVATIRALRADLSGEILVDVVAVEDLVVEPAELRLQQDGSPFRPTIRLLDARGRPLQNRPVKARCLDEKICTADGEQKVWPYNPGETVFEVRHEGLKRELKVIVEPAKRR